MLLPAILFSVKGGLIQNALRAEQVKKCLRGSGVDHAAADDRTVIKCAVSENERDLIIKALFVCLYPDR